MGGVQIPYHGLKLPDCEYLSLLGTRLSIVEHDMARSRGPSLTMQLSFIQARAAEQYEKDKPMLAMIGTRVRVLSKFTDAGLHWPGTIVDSEGRGEGFMYHVRLDGFGDKQTADFHGMRNIEGMAIVPPAEVSPL